VSKQIQQELDEDMVRLRRILHSVTKGDAETVRRRLQNRDEARILDIACGACNEAEALTDFVAELKGGGEKKIKLTGVDMRAREIEDAQRRFGGRHILEESGVEKEFDFLTGDASKLADHGEMGDDFDLVFLRHQNYWNADKTWEEIFDQALAKVGDDGRLIITSYFDKEHALALKAIQRLGGELIKTEFNEETRELMTPGKSVDRHVAIFRRKE